MTAQVFDHWDPERRVLTLRSTDDAGHDVFQQYDLNRVDELLRTHPSLAGPEPFRPRPCPFGIPVGEIADLRVNGVPVHFGPVVG